MSVALFLIALLATTVNGALGYGISSITVPLALFIVSSHALNPVLVVVELALSAYVLWLNRAGLRTAWPHAKYVVIALAPGVAAGTVVFARLDATTLRLATYVVLLPLILIQLAGVRRALNRRLRAGSFVLGTVVGAIYAITTVSGPPLAAFYNNQGLTHDEFRAALAAIKLAAAVMTVIGYTVSGVQATADLTLAAPFFLALLIGAPFGAALSRRFGDESFRRVCMGFAAIVVAFGASVALRRTGQVPVAAAYMPLAATLLAGPIALAYGTRRQPRTAPARVEER